MIKHWLVSLVVLLALAGCESQPPVNLFVKGSFNAIQQQHDGKPYIIMFWSQDCAYCMKEMMLLGRILKNVNDVSLITVATDPFLEQQVIEQHMLKYDLADAETWVFADAIVQKLYFDVDQRWRGELPLMFLFDANNSKIKQSGMMSEQALLAWLADVQPLAP